MTSPEPHGQAPPASPERIDRFGASLGGMLQELDWPLLGRTYCWEDGDDFFGDEDQGRLLDAGLAIATDLGTALGGLAPPGCGRSLYVGVGVAELAPMAFEALVLGREVRACSLDGDEVRELGRATAVVMAELGDGPQLPRIAGEPLSAGSVHGAFDHLWFVSVISDPEAFPALHDKLYERKAGAADEGSDFATGKGVLAEDRAHAEQLVGLAIEHFCAPGIVTTTDEELPFIEAAFAARGMKLTAPSHARLSPIVGDPLRHCAVELVS